MQLKTILAILISMVLCEALNGQVEIKGQVNTQNGEPIPYANIYLKNEALGCTAFRDGSFQLQLDSLYRDSLIVSCVGFKRAKLYLPEITAKKQLIVELDEHQQELAEVLVKPREMEVLTTGIEPWRFPVLSLTTCEGTFTDYSKARLITNDYQLDGFVKGVSIFICDEGVYESPFRVNLLKVDPISGKPSEPLINKDYVLQADAGGEWVNLDVESELIQFPPNGFFVVVQSLPVDSLQMVEYKKRFPEISEFELITSAPSFGRRSENCAKAAYRDWVVYRDTSFRVYSRPEVDFTSHCQSIRIKAEISYYADQKLKIKEVKPKRKLRKVVDVPEPDLAEYPQSSPLDLVHSLQKTTETADFAYLFNHLLYYENKEQLKEILPLVEELQTLANTSEEWQQQKEQTLQFIQKLESSLEQMEKSDERFFYTLNIDGAIHQLHYKDGTWRMGLDVELTDKMMEPPSSKMEEATH